MNNKVIFMKTWESSTQGEGGYDNTIGESDEDNIMDVVPIIS